ncbi:ABC transporter permease [Pseudomonas aeruginosa VRFPA03]|nr:ABC transporter permease [Pseudomonas aeruginosa VRFPA03]
MKHAHLIVPRTLVAGSASGELLYAPTGLSFWGGVDPRSAEVIDRHHPLSGRHLHGRLLAIPGGRGSCTGSSVLLELILGGCAPAAILLREPDEILALGAIVAEELFGRSLPIACLGDRFDELAAYPWARLADGRLELHRDAPPPLEGPRRAARLAERGLLMFDYTFHWRSAFNALPEMLAGSLVTLQVTALSMLFGILIALLLAFARLGGNRPLRAAAGAWISIARNTPALFQIYILYFGLGSFGLHVSSWFALLAGVTFNNAGYLAETFRGGLQAVPETQLRAARSLGMSAPQAYRLVVIPQLLRVVFYPLTNQLVWAMLMTSLGVVVGLTDDLTGVTQALNVKTFRTFEYFALAAVLYFAMAKLLVLAARLLGWRLFRY